MKLQSWFLAVISTFSLSSQAYAADNLKTSAPALSSSMSVPQKSETTSLLSSNTDRTSYAIGFDIGHNFKNQNIPLNTQAMTQGLKDGISGEKMLMTTKDMQSTLVNFQNELISKRKTEIAQINAKNKTDGEAFLEANKKKENVVTLPDGLQYKIIKPGTGASPVDADSVTVNYEGSLINGQVFDSSYTRGKPISFPVSNVIPGWTEALKLMNPGAEWMVYIPSALAYGEKGAGPISPNQTLIFKIDLISVQKSALASGNAAANKK